MRVTSQARPSAGVGFAGDQAEVLQGAQLAGHGGLADADVGGEFRGPLPAEFVQPDEQAVRGGLQVGVDLPGHLALVGPGTPEQHGQFPLQRQEFLVCTTGRHLADDAVRAVVSVLVHVSTP